MVIIQLIAGAAVGWLLGLALTRLDKWWRGQ